MESQEDFENEIKERFSSVSTLSETYISSIPHSDLAKLVSAFLSYSLQKEWSHSAFCSSFLSILFKTSSPNVAEHSPLFAFVASMASPSALVTDMMMRQDVLAALSNHTEDFVCKEEETMFPFHAPSLVCKDWNAAFGRKKEVTLVCASNAETVFEVNVKNAIFFDRHMVISLGRCESWKKAASFIKTFGEDTAFFWREKFRAENVKLMKTYIRHPEKGMVYTYPWLLHMIIKPKKETFEKQWWKTARMGKTFSYLNNGTVWKRVGVLKPAGKKVILRATFQGEAPTQAQISRLGLKALQDAKVSRPYLYCMKINAHFYRPVRNPSFLRVLPASKKMKHVLLPSTHGEAKYIPYFKVHPVCFAEPSYFSIDLGGPKGEFD